MTTCLITGCALVDSNEPERWVWGDLHQLEHSMVFVACKDENNIPAWHYKDLPIYEDGRIVYVTEFFERRGIFVFNNYTLNDKAVHFIMKSTF